LSLRHSHSFKKGKVVATRACARVASYVTLRGVKKSKDTRVPEKYKCERLLTGEKRWADQYLTFF